MVSLRFGLAGFALLHRRTLFTRCIWARLVLTGLLAHRRALALAVASRTGFPTVLAVIGTRALIGLPVNAWCARFAPFDHRLLGVTLARLALTPTVVIYAPTGVIRSPLRPA